MENRMSLYPETIPVRKQWEAPGIVLERPLEVSAQDAGPSGLTDLSGTGDGPPDMPNGYLGPLATSTGSAGSCF